MPDIPGPGYYLSLFYSIIEETALYIMHRCHRLDIYLDKIFNDYGNYFIHSHHRLDIYLDQINYYVFYFMQR